MCRETGTRGFQRQLACDPSRVRLSIEGLTLSVGLEMDSELTRSMYFNNRLCSVASVELCLAARSDHLHELTAGRLSRGSGGASLARVDTLAVPRTSAARAPYQVICETVAPAGDAGRDPHAILAVTSVTTSDGIAHRRAC